MDAMQDLRVLDLPITSGELVPFPLDEMETTFQAIDGTANMFAFEKTPAKFWIRVGEEYWRMGEWAAALRWIDLGVQAFKPLGPEYHADQIPLLCMLATYNIALARKAPKQVLATPRADKLSKTTSEKHPECGDYSIQAPRTKDYYFEAARNYLRDATQLDRTNKLVLEGSAVLSLAMGKMEEASRSFEAILRDEPTNLFALSGKARCLFARKAYKPALKTYQTILAYAPTFLPDPRIAIGLCFYMLGERDVATKAWERSLAVNPNSSSNTATLLLGISAINASRSALGSAAGPHSDEARAASYTKGVQLVQKAFKMCNTTAGAANALSVHLLAMGEFSAVIKYSERQIQYSDLRSLTSDGHLWLARALQGQSQTGTTVAGVDAEQSRKEKEEASMLEYGRAMGGVSDEVLSALAVVQQLLVSSDQYPAATDLLTSTLGKHPNCIEALVALASIHTHVAFTSPSSADSTKERKLAKELYERALRLLSTTAKDPEHPSSIGSSEQTASPRYAAIAQDAQFYLELARLFEDEHDISRSLGFLKQAERIYKDDGATGDVSMDGEEGTGLVPHALSNNIAVLEFHRGSLTESVNGFENTLTEIAKAQGTRGEGEEVLLALTYNLGCVYEALGEKSKAEAAWHQVLSRHVEFADAKARLALLALQVRDYEKAHGLIKEALTTQPTNTELRALYTYFLISTNAIKPARDFTLATLNEHFRHDLYALCSAGYINYTMARENKDPSKPAAKERAIKFLRTAEFYEKALMLDPHCAFAAQGLAICVAEGTLGTGVKAETPGGGSGLGEAGARARNSRDALTILMKVKESVRDGSVFINMGHCHFAREEWEKAIESYDTASHRFYQGKNVQALLYLARSWYHKAIQDHSFSDLRRSLAAVKAARDLVPDDLSILFNIAIVQQKGVEIIFDLPPTKRSLAEIHVALEDGAESQALFERLHQDKTANPPYGKDIPYQRQRFGQSVLKKAVDVIAIQEAYEEEERTRLANAKILRDAERQRVAEAAAMVVAEEARRAEQLAAQRKIMRDEAANWVTPRDVSDDEDDEKKSKGKKRKAKGKKDDDESEEGQETGDEDGDDKPKKKQKKKTKKVARGNKMVVDGSDDDEPVQSKKKSGKNFKSSEYVNDSDSDEENGEADRTEESAVGTASPAVA